MLVLASSGQQVGTQPRYRRRYLKPFRKLPERGVAARIPECDHKERDAINRREGSEREHNFPLGSTEDGNSYYKSACTLQCMLLLAHKLEHSRCCTAASRVLGHKDVE